MQALASFDRWLTRRAFEASVCHAQPSQSGARNTRADSCKTGGFPLPQTAEAARNCLVSPWGEKVVPLSPRASAAAIVRAAFGVGRGDWLGLLADDSRSSGTRQAWRLACWREGAQGLQPQWLSPAVQARPGQAPAVLKDAVLKEAVHALWQQGWRLQEAWAQDLH